MIIGSHVQMKAPLYFEGAVQEMLSYNANALMLYTGAPQNTRRVSIDKMHLEEGKKLLQDNNIPLCNVIVHAPYIINCANSVKQEVGQLAHDFLQQEVERVQQIGANYLVLHPGSYTTTDLETGIQTIIKQLNDINVPESVTICLETMSGKGSEVGFTFEQLSTILNNLNQKDRYGVCLDTCHINDAGYDLNEFDNILKSFDDIIGLNRLHVIHLNDSKNPISSHKDRHENIGKGTIGLDILSKIAHHPLLTNIPKILETPYIDGKPPYKEEIALIKNTTN